MNLQEIEKDLIRRIIEIQTLQLELQAKLIPYVRDHKFKNLFNANFASQFMNKSIEAAMESLR